jgi:hypothetical protein
VHPGGRGGAGGVLHPDRRRGLQQDRGRLQRHHDRARRRDPEQLHEPAVARGARQQRLQQDRLLPGHQREASQLPERDGHHHQEGLRRAGRQADVDVPRRAHVLFEHHHHDRVRELGAAHQLGEVRHGGLRRHRDPALRLVLPQHGRDPRRLLQVGVHLAVRVQHQETRKAAPEDRRAYDGVPLGDRRLRPHRSHHVRRVGEVDVPRQRLLLRHQSVQAGTRGLRPGDRLRERQRVQTGHQLHLHPRRPRTGRDVFQPDARGSPSESGGVPRGLPPVPRRHESEDVGVLQTLQKPRLLTSLANKLTQFGVVTGLFLFRNVGNVFFGYSWQSFQIVVAS